MIRKFWIAGVSMLMCLAVGGTSLFAVEYSEAPMLRVRVAAGELPPIEERLPKEPVVVEPVEMIGQYGGTLHAGEISVIGIGDTTHMRLVYLFRLDKDGNRVPEVATGYDFSGDYKTLTVYLREGLKWSDGYPFTTDDIMFWYEDVLLNEQLTPVKYAWWSPGGEPVEFVKIDDYTLQIRSVVPFRHLIDQLSYHVGSQNFMFHPKHYLKKWHIKYNPKADELAKEEGYDHWWEALQFHWRSLVNQGDPNLPKLSAWILKERTPTYMLYERNPYYMKVDAAGNQLPYIDKLIVEIVGNQEVYSMKAVSGDLDYTGIDLKIRDYPFYKENAEKGNYRVLLWDDLLGAETFIAFNLNHKDPNLREIFQNLKFRQAMSLAINRDEINQVVFYGLCTPRQPVVLPTASYYKEEWGKTYTEYDPERANRLLDEMGLDRRDAQGFRLRPDGNTLAITIEYFPGFGPKTLVAEMIKRYWDKVGVKVALKSEELGLVLTRGAAGELDVSLTHMDRMTEFRSYTIDTHWRMRGWNCYAVDWAWWDDTNGQKGEEPPEHVKDYFDLREDWFNAQNDEEYFRLAQEVWDFRAKELWLIGTVGMGKVPIVVKNNLRNVPEQCYLSEDFSWWKVAEPEQWFLEEK